MPWTTPPPSDPNADAVSPEIVCYVSKGGGEGTSEAPALAQLEERPAAGARVNGTSPGAGRMTAERPQSSHTHTDRQAERLQPIREHAHEHQHAQARAYAYEHAQAQAHAHP